MLAIPTEMMTKFNRLLLSALALCATNGFGAENKKLTLLTQIRDSVQLGDDMYVQSEPLFLVDPSPNTEAVNIDVHWMGQTPYLATLSRVQLTQIILDTLMAFPHKSFSEVTIDERHSVIKTLYLNIIRSPINGDTLELIDDYIASIAKNDFTETYLLMHNLSQRALNCQAYWENNKTQIHPTIKGVQKPASFKGELPKTPEYFDKVFCSTVPRKFNGFHNISATAKKLKDRLDNLECHYTGAFSKRKKGLCTYLSTVYQRNRKIDALQEDPLVTTSLQDGYDYLEDLVFGINNIQDAARSLLILEINSLISASKFPYISFSRLYRSTDHNLPLCPKDLSDSPLKNAIRCGPTGSPRPNSNLDIYVDQLLGTGEIPLAIKPGLPLGLIETDSATTHLLIAGDYQTLKLNKATYGRPSSWSTKAPSDNSNVLFLSTDQVQNLQSLRHNLLTEFYDKRHLAQSKHVFTLLTKSVGIDIVNTMRKQNEEFVYYGNGDAKYATHPTHTLKESSEWRLRPTSGWLESIATMSNTGLLREIVVLLAELKQLQFLQFTTQQKSLLLFAVRDALRTDIGSTETFKAQTTAESHNYRTGTSSSDESIALPPNDGATEEQNEADTDKMKELGEQYG